MRSLLSRLRLRAAAATMAAVAAMAALPAPAAHAGTAAIPTFTDGFGLTQVGVATGTATDFLIKVTTAKVAGEHNIRIMLPADYATDPGKRYPVLYTQHGAPDNPSSPGWAFPALKNANMITVIPDGGRRGWYTNWVRQDTVAGAQRWKDFHLDQLLPFIDANLRTIADKRHRAIAGYSMGGFGALHYAQTRPELFSHVASMSGANDLRVNGVKLAVTGTELNLGSWCSIPGSGSGDSCTYGPSVPLGSVFGSPLGTAVWNALTPATHTSKLAGMGVYLYTGNQGTVEAVVEATTKNLIAGLKTNGLPYHYVNYGDGSTWGTGCNGGHGGTGGFSCLAQDLVDLIPRLEKAFTEAD